MESISFLGLKKGKFLKKETTKKRFREKNMNIKTTNIKRRKTKKIILPKYLNQFNYFKKLKLFIKKHFFLILLSLLFAFSYMQSPLYHANQNVYLIQGIAQAGQGFLSEDWLIKQTDPFVFVTMLTKYAHYFDQRLIHGMYVIILSLYFNRLQELRCIVRKLLQKDPLNMSKNRNMNLHIFKNNLENGVLCQE